MQASPAPPLIWMPISRKGFKATRLYGFAYEWLVDKGLVDKLSMPLHLTKKSQVTVDEAAYFYDEDVPDWAF